MAMERDDNNWHAQWPSPKVRPGPVRSNLHEEVPRTVSFSCSAEAGSSALDIDQSNGNTAEDYTFGAYSCTQRNETLASESLSQNFHCGTGAVQTHRPEFISLPYSSPTHSATQSPSVTSDTAVGINKPSYHLDWSSRVSPPTGIDDEPVSAITSQPGMANNMYMATPWATTAQVDPWHFPVGVNQAPSQVSDMGESSSDAGTFPDASSYDAQVLMDYAPTVDFSAASAEPYAPTSTPLMTPEYKTSQDPEMPIPCNSQIQQLLQVDAQRPAQHAEGMDGTSFHSTPVAASPPNEDQSPVIPVTAPAPPRCKRCDIELEDDVTAESHDCKPLLCLFSFAGCNSRFGAKNEWKRHMQTQHVGTISYKCRDCFKEFCRKDLFSQHYQRIHLFPNAKWPIKVNDWEPETERKMQDAVINARVVNKDTVPSCRHCLIRGCREVFPDHDSWIKCMEHVARHLQLAAGGREPRGHPQFPEPMLRFFERSGVVERTGPGTWRLGPRGNSEKSRGNKMRLVKRSKQRLMSRFLQ